MARSLSADELEQYDHVPLAIAEGVRVHTVRVLAPGAAGMAIGRHILVRKDDTTGRSALIAHELVHAQQWADEGVVGFLGRYLNDYVRGLRKYRSHRSAYLDIGHERAARTKTEIWRHRPRKDL